MTHVTGVLIGVLRTAAHLVHTVRIPIALTATTKARRSGGCLQDLPGGTEIKPKAVQGHVNPILVVCTAIVRMLPGFAPQAFAAQARAQHPHLTRTMLTPPMGMTTTADPPQIKHGKQ